METQPRYHRPRLVSHARYRWDKRREQHQLVYPEGVLILNATAAAIVQLCDGREVEDIVSALQEQGSPSGVERDVSEFIERLTAKGLLCESEPPQ